VWSPGGQNTTSIEVTAAGDYSVTANGSEGCPATSEVISITAAQAPVANFTYTQPSGYLIEFTNTSENGTSYSWNFGAATTTSVNPTFTFPFDGEYPVTLIATNACGSDTIKITVIVKKFVGINELAAKANLQLHPVPAADLLNLELNYPVSEECVISVVNLTGQEIYREVCMLGGQLIRTIQSAHLAAGVYLLRVNSKSGSISRKFTKN
jgi:PKD repeat protein